MAATEEVTAWGKCEVSMAPTGASDAMATTLTSVGTVKEDSTKLTVTNGDTKELYGEGHELKDSKELNGYWELSFTIIKASLSQIAAICGKALSETDSVLKAGKTSVSEIRSYQVSPELTGAIMAKMPKCKTSVTPVFQTAEGWTVDVKVRALVPSTGVDDACQLSVKP